MDRTWICYPAKDDIAVSKQQLSANKQKFCMIFLEICILKPLDDGQRIVVQIP